MKKKILIILAIVLIAVAVMVKLLPLYVTFISLAYAVGGFVVGRKLKPQSDRYEG